MSTDNDRKVMEHEDEPLRKSMKVGSFKPVSTKRIWGI